MEIPLPFYVNWPGGKHTLLKLKPALLKKQSLMWTQYLYCRKIALKLHQNISLLSAIHTCTRCEIAEICGAWLLWSDAFSWFKICVLGVAISIVVLYMLGLLNYYRMHVFWGYEINLIFIKLHIFIVSDCVNVSGLIIMRAYYRFRNIGSILVNLNLCKYIREFSYLILLYKNLIILWV